MRNMNKIVYCLPRQYRQSRSDQEFQCMHCANINDFTLFSRALHTHQTICTDSSDVPAGWKLQSIKVPNRSRLGLSDTC